MKDLKTTKGKLVIKNSGSEKFPFYQILEGIAEVAATHNLTIAKLTVDSYNTAQLCGLLPSELLKQRDELMEALKALKSWVFQIQDWSGVGDPPIEIVEAAITKAEAR